MPLDSESMLTLNVTEVPIAKEDLYVDIEQEKENIASSMKLFTNSTNGVLMEDNSSGLNINVSDDMIINQEVDKILEEYNLFKSNTYNARAIVKCLQFNASDNYKVLISLLFFKSTTDNIKFYINYGWEVDDSTQIDQELLNYLYSYITKRFKTTVENFQKMKQQIPDLQIESKSYYDEGMLVSSPTCNEGLRIGNANLYSLGITQTS